MVLPAPGLCDITARASKDDVGGAQTPLTEDSCLPVLQTGCMASWDSAHSQVRTLERSHHLVAVTERREGGATFLPPLSQGDGGRVKQRSIPTQWELPIRPSRQGLCDLETAAAPHCATLPERMDAGVCVWEWTKRAAWGEVAGKL